MNRVGGVVRISFIVNFPRSGSTLLQALLATQEGVCPLPETHFYSAIRKACTFGPGGIINPECLPAVFESLGRKLSVELDDGEREMIGDLARVGRLGSRDLFLILVSAMRRRFPLDAGLDAMVLEKTPHHALYLDTIASEFPEAAFVAIVRHPLAAIQSFKERFSSRHQWTYRELAAKWRCFQDSIDSFAASRGGLIVSLRYEDLVARIGESLTGVCRHLGLEYDESRLVRRGEHKESFVMVGEDWKRGVFDDSIVNNNAASLSRIDPNEAQWLAEELSEYMERFGYARPEAQ